MHVDLHAAGDALPQLENGQRFVGHIAAVKDRVMSNKKSFVNDKEEEKIDEVNDEEDEKIDEVDTHAVAKDLVTCHTHLTPPTCSPSRSS